ncbi:Serine acetyltransferase [Pigmentiphaga humi]|uniref:Serine acetyltransferase n=1 Tax=Pigmentiphaga humi TaxID=2478468 RepID=A0A3P4B3X0_9BURK|nr:serine O-acetyltransferase EpsC [Pigmentiphaga humi]VCU70732.1 Serine acetyltransferase [Pigmentiphaga humi]
MNSPYHASPDVSPEWNLADIVDQLRQSREIEHKIRYLDRVRELPSRETLVTVLDGLAATLFPTHYGRCRLTNDSIDYFVGNTLNATLNLLFEQVRRALYFSEAPETHDKQNLQAKAIEITRRFAARLPAIRSVLVSDLHAAYQGDPAATSISEVLLSYPGIKAVIHYRLAHAIHQLGAPVLARLISDIAHSSTGIDIHPAARIGASFFIDHGTGVVIGETTIIGERVRLYQAVTLGAKSFPADPDGKLTKGIARHPIVEDDVVIYAGATILGRITIGRGSTVGGNVWLTQSVPPDTNVTQAKTQED